MYVADSVGLLVRNVYGLKNADDFPLYSDFFENHGTTVDRRTAEEIKDDILRRLME